MRQSIGGTWLIQLMILFILLFAGYIILTVDYNKSIKVKNEVTSMIEKYEGLNEKSINLVNNYLISMGYRTTGLCSAEEGAYGALSLEDNTLESVEAGQKYYYCIRKYRGANTSSYYQLNFFYHFNLPVLGDISRFNIKGTTSNFQAKDDELYQDYIGG